MTCYDNYPARYVILNVILVAAAASAGLLITAQVGWWAVGLYGLVGGLGTILSLAWGCTRCHYYGRMCGLSLGKLAALGFEKRAEAEFGKGWSQTLAWSLVGLASAMPLIAGLIHVSENRTLSTAAPMVVYLVLVATIALTHGNVVCRRCWMAQQGRCRLGRMAAPS